MSVNHPDPAPDLPCAAQLLCGSWQRGEHLDDLPASCMDELLALEIHARVSDGRSPAGMGANVLGDPVDALVWLVNELGAHGITLQSGQFVTTGACVPPIPVRPGDAVEADFGWLGRLGVRFV
jgi:2-keto-4-pentenoate hydratase